MSILETLGINSGVLGSFIDEPTLSSSSRRTTRLTVGRETSYEMSINGKQVNGYITLLEPARMTRLSLLQQRRRSDGELYWLATGIMSPVKLKVEAIVNGVRYDMIDLFHSIAQEESAKKISREEFVNQCENIGLKFNTGMACFWQQFGADENEFKNLVEIFKAAGAQDAISSLKQNNGSVKVAYGMPKNTPGPLVTSFEVGTVDRSQSARFEHNKVGQGFLNFLDAQYDQFIRIVGLRKSAKIKTHEAMNADGLTEAQITALKNGAKKDLDLAGQWTSNWGGAQKRIAQMKDGSFVDHDQYDPVAIPCGRLTVVHNGQDTDIDLWTNKNIETSTTVTETSASAPVSIGQEEPV